MGLPMAVKKAVGVVKRGPKTETQRIQAIKTLRRFAREVKDDYPNMASAACAAAKGLADLGDINLR